jgi:hypothetical protein
MTFYSNTKRRAVIEALNNGEAFILLYDLDGNNETLDWNIPPEVQLQQLETLHRYLRS